MFFAIKNTVFLSTAAIKKQRQLVNLKNPAVVCSYHSYIIEFPVVISGCQVEGFPSRLHHSCQGGYVILCDFDFEGGKHKRKIFHDCVEKFWGGGGVR